MRHRDDVNELYDCACALLQAAHELREAASRPGSAAAYTATLGCIEDSLSALTESVAMIRARVSVHLSGAAAGRPPAVASASAELGALCRELDEAGRAAGTARTAVAPLLSEACVD